MGKLAYQDDDPAIKVKKPKAASGEKARVAADPNAIKSITGDRGAEGNVTKLAAVDPSSYTDKGTMDESGKINDAYWNIFNGGMNAGGGGGGGKGDLSISLADRSKEFGDFQNQTTQFTSDLMKNAGDQANSMFGQGAYNQMTGDNDQVVQSDIAALQEQFGGNVNHPAFIQAKNDMLMTAKMYNARAYTDLKQKAGQYGLQVAEVAKNYYDVYSTREEDQQKLKLATDQYNTDMKFKQRQAGAAAGRAAQGVQLAALAALNANNQKAIDRSMDASQVELQARSADKVSLLNLQMEREKIASDQAIAKKKNSNNIFSSILNGVASMIPVVGNLFKNKE
jgi:hypothetical protein